MIINKYNIIKIKRSHEMGNPNSLALQTKENSDKPCPCNKKKKILKKIVQTLIPKENLNKIINKKS